MILLALVLAYLAAAHGSMGDCDGRTVGLHRECAALAGPVVPGQDLRAPRSVQFGHDFGASDAWKSPAMVRCVSSPYLCSDAP